MNQLELKKLFKSSVKNGHVNNTHLLPFLNSQTHEIKIKEEGYFRNFDLVIALINKENKQKKTNYEYFDLEYDIQHNILMRSQQFTEFSKLEKCRIENITFIPVEIKSDNDVLDERLPNQILNAILTFGRSYLVIDKKYVPKRSFMKLLINNNISNKISEMVKIYHSLITLEQINQKLVFNYLFRSEEENLDFDFLLKEEIDFLKQFYNFSTLPSEKTNKKQIKKLIKDSRNYLITDFL